jgi:hypothetical protein
VEFVEMKKLKLRFTLFFLLIGSLAFAQTTQPDNTTGSNPNDVESQHIAFITQQLALTPEEAQAFWPVYNKYHQMFSDLKKSRGTPLLRPNFKIDNYTDDQISAMIENELNYKQKEAEMQQQYYEELKKVLPIKKVGKLYRAEQLFKLYLVNGMNTPNQSGAKQNDNNKN